MPSGKRSRQRRQAPVQASEPRRASPKVVLGAAGVVAIAALAVVLVAQLGNGSSPAREVPARGSLDGALPGAAEVNRLFRGIPQHGNRLGSPTAPVTMVTYVDLQCPHCRDFDALALPELIARYVRSGRLQVELRPIAFLGPDSEDGRAAAIAAAGQNRMFDLTALLYRNQGAENTGWLDEELLAAAAASIPALDVPRLLEERSSPEVADRARLFDAEAREQQVTSTPTVLVGRSGTLPRRVKLSSASDVASIAEAIDRAQR
jgi:protein-disulfide isomerase